MFLVSEPHVHLAGRPAYSKNESQMRPHFLLLGVLGLQVAAQDEGLTIDIVSSQINDFLQSIRNGTLDARDASSKLPSTCALAVRRFNSTKHPILTELT